MDPKILELHNDISALTCRVASLESLETRFHHYKGVFEQSTENLHKRISDLEHVPAPAPETEGVGAITPNYFYLGPTPEELPGTAQQDLIRAAEALNRAAESARIHKDPDHVKAALAEISLAKSLIARVDV